MWYVQKIVDYRPDFLLALPRHCSSFGEANLDFRYHYENVDQDDFKSTASANTLRSRLTLSSAAWHEVSSLAEVDNVWDFGSDNYNSTGNGNTQYPVIADPTGTDLNQVWLKCRR